MSASAPVSLAPQISDVLAYSDRIILPQSLLEQLVSEAGNEPLPSPLTFRLVNSANNAFTYCGVREFSAPESSVLLSPQVASTLGILPKQLVDSSAPAPAVSVAKVDLPKGTFVALRPLDSAYLTIDDDWKALLESSLQSSYTTLTEGQTFSIKHPASQETMSFLVDNLQPEKAVCIVETDLTVDIVALSEEHARKSVAIRKAKEQARSTHASTIIADQQVAGSFNTEESLAQPFYYELKSWDKSRTITVTLEILDASESNERDIDSRAADVFISVDDQPSQGYFLWSTQTEERNSISIEPSNLFIKDAEHLMLSVQSFVHPLSFSLKISQTAEVVDLTAGTNMVADSVQCSNCERFFPQRTLQLHSAFCQRNNILCPHPGCTKLFRRQEGIPTTHWHCDTDFFSSDSVSSKEKHIKTHHIATSCGCGEQFSSLQNLAQHRATACPQKLHTCRFCHLKLPQESLPDSQSDLLAGYTGHESRCGTRTTECSRCGRIVRLRDMISHTQLHVLQRVSSPVPKICANTLCVRMITGNTNILGLCSSCYAPLYSPMHDPSGARLKSRIERRYFTQLFSGCKHSLCDNQACATGRGNLELSKLAPGEIGPLVKELVDGGKLQFCVEDSMTRRKHLVDWVADDKIYSRPWICKAVNEVADDGEDVSAYEARVRSWLTENGVQISEAKQMILV
ncbi:ubiquitin fusion degradation protein 1 [Lipomyces arxii]|uniref:ubiquitin fusion degradation protein 1 n=1 Tax=Lipomyces arxii TaxID=56418 RepID=UPI0034CE407D